MVEKIKDRLAADEKRTAADGEFLQQEGLLEGSEYDETNYLRNWKTTTSRDFMDEVTYTVPLDKLYDIEQSCSSHEGCQNQGVLLKIKDQQLMDHNYKGATHLIQVWNNKGEMILQRDLNSTEVLEEKKLNELHAATARISQVNQKNFEILPVDNPIHCWNVSNSYFIYMLKGQLQQSDYLIVLDLLNKDENGCCFEYRITNAFQLDPSFQFMGCFNSRFLFVAQQTALKFIDFQELIKKANSRMYPHLRKEGNVYTFDIDPNDPDLFKRREFAQLPIKMVAPTLNMEIVKLSSQSKLKDIINLGKQRKVLAFETELNQLVYYNIDFKDIPGQEGMLYLTECHHQKSRKELASGKGKHFEWNDDPIREFTNVMSWCAYEKDFIHFGIALRHSGCIDFYYDYRLVEETKRSIKDSCDKLGQRMQSKIDKIFKKDVEEDEKDREAGDFNGVLCDFEFLYFKDNVNIYMCPMSWKSDIGLRVSQIFKVDAKKSRSKAKKEAWDALQSNRLSQNVKIFPCFLLMFTKMVVAHHNMISIYDILNKSWKNQHFSFESPIVSVFRSNFEPKEKIIELGVLLRNNTLRKLKAAFSKNTDLEISLSEESAIELPGQLMNHCFDLKTKDSAKTLYMLIDTAKPFNSMKDEFNLGFLCQNNNYKTMKSVSYVRHQTYSRRIDFLAQKKVKPEEQKLLDPIRNAINEGSYTEDSDISEEEKLLLAAPRSKAQSGIRSKKIVSFGEDLLQEQNELEMSATQSLNSSMRMKKKLSSGSGFGQATIPFLNEDKQNPQTLYVLRKSKIYKIQYIEYGDIREISFPTGTTMRLEYDCVESSKESKEEPKKTFIFFENRRLSSQINKQEPIMCAFQLFDDDLTQKPLIQYADLEFELQKRRKVRGQQNFAEGSLNAVISPIIDSSDWKKEKVQRMKDEQKYKLNRVAIVDGDLCIYDREGKIRKPQFTKRNINNAMQIDQEHLYTICDKRFAWNNEKRKPDKDGRVLNAGLFLYDYHRLLTQGQIEVYKIRDAIGGINNHIDFSSFSQRISIMTSLEKIEIVPVPHRNVINFLGMRPKKDYMCWHHQKNTGVFTAVDKQGLLQQWSCTTGKLLEKEDQETGKRKILEMHQTGFPFKQYDIHQGSKNDKVYMNGWQNRGDYSLFLLRHKDPIYKFFHTDIGDLNSSQSSRTMNSLARGLQGLVRAQQQEQYGQEFEYRKFCLIKLNQTQVEIVYEYEHFYLDEKKVKVDADGVCQRFYFNQDLKKMFERTGKSMGRIYKKEKVDGTLVSWKLQHTLKRFPSQLAGECSLLFLFSPSFKYYIDVDYEEGEFLVVDLKRDKKYYIPKGLLNLSIKGDQKTKKALNKLARMMTFYDDNTLRIINKGGDDCLFKFKESKVVNVNSIDNFKVNYYKFNHYIHEPEKLCASNCFERLLRIADSLKILQSRIFESELHQTEKLEHKIATLYSHLFNIDYSLETLNQEGASQFLALELSFTYLDYQIIEKLIKERNFDLKNIDIESQVQQCFNIFPGLQTTFHKLALTKKVNFDSATVATFYKSAKECKNVKHLGNRSFVLPLLQDMRGQSPIDCLFYDCETKGKIENPNTNFAWQFLNSIKDYPFLHSGRIVNRIIPDALHHNVPDLGEFLNSRIVKSLHLQSEQLDMQALHENSKQANDMDYVDTTGCAWANKDKLVGKLFDQTKFKRPMKIRYVDLPELHLNTEIGKEFWEEVGFTEDLDLFNFDVMQILINYKWERIEPKIFNRYLRVYTIFLIFYSTWSNLIYLYRADAGFWRLLDFVITLVLNMFVVYFAKSEIHQLNSCGFVDYFTDGWNYLDMVPLVTVPLITLWSALQELTLGSQHEAYTTIKSDSIRDYIQSVTALFMWAKFLYFLRATTTFGWLIRIMIEVANDMKYFLFVYFITVLAFADAYYSLSLSQKAQNDFRCGGPCPDEGYEHLLGDNGAWITTWRQAVLYSYAMSLGQFGFDNFGVEYQYDLSTRYLCWTYFFLATIINMIIMLNLLIAIISETYTAVSDKKTARKYQEKTKLISDYLFLDDEYDEKKKDDLLIIAIEDAESKRSKQLTLKDVTKQIRNLDTDVQGNFDKVGVKLKTQNETLEAIKEAQKAQTDAIEQYNFFEKQSSSTSDED